jgi:hypothetical protein
MPTEWHRTVAQTEAPNNERRSNEQQADEHRLSRRTCRPLATESML